MTEPETMKSTIWDSVRDLVVYYNERELCLQPVTQAAQSFIASLQEYGPLFRGAMLIPGDAADAVLAGMDQAGVTYLMHQVATFAT